MLLFFFLGFTISRDIKFDSETGLLTVTCEDGEALENEYISNYKTANAVKVTKCSIYTSAFSGFNALQSAEFDEVSFVKSYPEDNPYDYIVFFKDSQNVKLTMKGSFINETDFYYNDHISELNLVSSVIRKEAFEYCKNLTKLTMKDIDVMHESAFLGCEKLEEVNLDNVMLNISAFKYCSSLKTFNTNGVDFTNIPDELFSGCMSLTFDFSNKGIKTIGSEAFRNAAIEELKLPDTVTTIGNSAFYDCVELKTVKIPTSVTSIGSSAFCDCSNLTYFEVVSSDEELEIGDNGGNGGIFSGCINLVTINLGGRVHKIFSNFFKNCHNLESIKLTKINSIEQMIGSPFDGCTNLTTIEIEADQLDYTDNGLFSNLTNLSQVNLSFNSFGTTSKTFEFYNGLNNKESFNLNIMSKNSITIKENTFKGIYDKITIGNDGIINVNDRVILTSKQKNIILEKYAFAFSGISIFAFPENVQILPQSDHCFSSSLIEQIDFSKPPTYTIPYSSFSNCTKLSQLKIKKCSLDSNVFELCTGLKNVTIELEDVSSFTFANCTNLTKITFNGVTNIYERSFENCTSLEVVTIPDSVVQIGLYAFINCESLQKVTYGENSKITKIANSTFANCKCLSEIQLPKKIEILEFGAFANCTKLSKFDFDKSLKIIAKRAFYGCGAEEINLEIYSFLDEIGVSAFEGCFNLKTIKIPRKTKTISERAFANCKSLESIVLSSSSSFSMIETIGESAFEDCTNLKFVYLTIRVKTIGKRAFAGCTSLIKVHFNGTSALNDIGSYAFVNCEHLKSTNVLTSDTVKSFGENIFEGCNSLESIVIGNGVDKIPPNAFKNCASLKSVNLGSSVNEIDQLAFVNCTELQSLRLNSEITLYPETFTNSTNLVIYTNDENNLYTESGITYNKNSRNVVYMNPNTVDNIINVPDFISSIYPDMYVNLNKVNRVLINDGVIRISTKGFYNCSFSYVRISKTVSTIEEGAFTNCDSLKTIEIAEDNSYFSNYQSDGIVYNKALNKLVMVPPGLESLQLPSTLEEISTMSFNDCSKLTTIILPETVNTIQNETFVGTASNVNIYYCGNGLKDLKDYKLFDSNQSATIHILDSYKGYDLSEFAPTKSDASDKCFGSNDFDDSNSTTIIIIVVVVVVVLLLVAGIVFYVLKFKKDDESSSIGEFKEYP